MATSTMEPDQHAVPPFAEHDNLGLLGAKTSVLENEPELRRALVGAFASTAGAARAATAQVETDVSTAVHEYRKALRRARAVLSLLEGALPKSERRAVRRALQQARRTVSGARDLAVAPEVLNGLSLDEVSRGAANAALANAVAAMPAAAEIKQLLAEGAARAMTQVEALEAALPQEISWKTVADGVRTLYAAARDARKAAKTSKRKFHSWRRRCKELTYALEVISGFTALHVNELEQEIETVADAASPAVDLVMALDFVRTYGQGVAPEAFEQLTSSLDTQLHTLMRAARRAGKHAFHLSPKKFVRRLTKAVKKDLATPSEPAADSDSLPDDHVPG
ncbi:hypothetical protein BH11MYX1_BH11MYX1_24320 [soil metagenome]